MRKVKLYVVKEIETGNIYSVVCKLKDAEQYIKIKVFYDHFTHFKSWCEFKNLDYKVKSNYENYYVNCIATKDPVYTVEEHKYTPEALATIFRTLYNYVPLNCSYETQVEKELFNTMVEAVQKQLYNQSEVNNSVEGDNNPYVN